MPALFLKRKQMKTKALKNKKQRYWGGFSDGFLCGTTEKCGDEIVLAIYFRKKDARANYEDVRPVEIREIKK